MKSVGIQLTPSSGQPFLLPSAYPAAGEQGTVDYCDSTPDVSFAYRSLGRQIRVTDGIYGNDPTGYALEAPGTIYRRQVGGARCLSHTHDHRDYYRKSRKRKGQTMNDAILGTLAGIFRLFALIFSPTNAP